MAPTITNGASTVTKVESSTNKNNYFVIDFDASVSENAFWTMTFPRNWDTTVPMSASLYWIPADSNNSVAIFNLKARAVGTQESLDGTWGAHIFCSASYNGTGNSTLYQKNFVGTLSASNSPVDGDHLFFNLERAATQSADTYAGDVRIVGIRLSYKIDSAVTE
jgi:hypothetical protein